MLNRRNFLQTTTAATAIAATSLANAQGTHGARRELTEAEKLARIASNTYSIRQLFPSRGGSSRADAAADAMKKKYGTITLLDFPQFTKDTFPGVYHMDVWSSLFGDVKDPSMDETVTMTYAGRERTFMEFDPATPSAKKWLDQFANKIAATGTRCHHISNNAPRNIAEPDDALRSTRVMNEAGFQGIFCLEYEAGPGTESKAPAI